MEGIDWNKLYKRVGKYACTVKFSNKETKEDFIQFAVMKSFEKKNPCCNLAWLYVDFYRHIEGRSQTKKNKAKREIVFCNIDTHYGNVAKIEDERPVGIMELILTNLNLKPEVLEWSLQLMLKRSNSLIKNSIFRK